MERKIYRLIINTKDTDHDFVENSYERGSTDESSSLYIFSTVDKAKECMKKHYPEEKSGVNWD